mmetsp:Transcript_65483/g.191627  ORF Transcript_65483/g.191627 Transcript_65483/m.191627 type:complete len:532 (-) Transcript_65483:94-1689(-)
MAAGLLSAWALALCLSGALAGAAPQEFESEVLKKFEGLEEQVNSLRDLEQKEAEMEQKKAGLWDFEQKVNKLSKKLECGLPSDPGKEPKWCNNNETANLTQKCCEKCSNFIWNGEEKKCLPDQVEGLFNGLGDVADFVGKNWLTTDCAFFVAIFLVLQWHVRFHFREWLRKELYSRLDWQPLQVKPMMIWRRIGLNILILGLIGLIMFYMKDLNKNRNTHVSGDFHYGLWMVAVIFQMHAGDQQVGVPFNTKFWMHILGKPRILERLSNFVTGANEDSSKTREPLLHKEDRLKSALQKMRLPPRQVEKLLRRDMTDEDVKVLEDISNKEDRNEDPEASATAAFFKRMNVELEDDFKKMLGLEESLQYVGSLWHRVFLFFPLKFQIEWIIRCGMDFMVNSFARTIILYTVPIMVCVEHPMDCVKDLTAVMFVTTLDNLDGDAKDLAEILVKLKYRANHALERRAKVMADDEVEPQKVRLNMFEKNFIQGHPDNFWRVDFVGGDAWKKFRRQGIPMTEEELDAEEETNGKAHR